MDWTSGSQDRHHSNDARSQTDLAYLISGVLGIVVGATLRSPATVLVALGLCVTDTTDIRKSQVDTGN
jgi:hypothetical protein